ncbi:MAG: ABC transporter permease [Spirochaetales bacterium]|nr:ABC transporter permease [Spirochaetales bacterium]
MIFLKIAFLNIRKHARRSLLIMFVVMVSVVLMMFMGGMMDGMRVNFYKSLYEDSGHIQVHAEGYGKRLNPFSLKYQLSDPDSLIEELKKVDGVESAEKIIPFGGLVVHNGKNMALQGVGISPSTTYFSHARNNITAGEFDLSGDGLVISRKTAEMLDLKLEDYAAIIVEDADGAPYYLDYRVKGFFGTGESGIDTGLFFLSHANAETLLNLDNRTIEVRLNLKDADLSQTIKTRIEPIVKKHKGTASTWEEIFGSFVVLIKAFDFFIYFINIFVIIVGGTVITNAILMNQFERIREFGTMRAIGLKKHQLFSLILSEGSFEGAMGSVFGLLLGILLVLYFQQNGLNMGKIMEEFRMGSNFHFALTVKNALTCFISGILVAVTGSLYAAGTCAKMKLIDSLRFV